jgi:hypothetical protein
LSQHDNDDARAVVSALLKLLHLDPATGHAKDLLALATEGMRALNLFIKAVARGTR